jgi:HK97 family phage major capsid protein
MEIKKLIEELGKNPPQRFLTISREKVDKGSRSVEISFSSELPVTQPWGIEILDHSDGCMRMDRMKNGIALLYDHKTEQHIGVVEDCRCDDDKKGRATARFSRSPLASEKLQDVEDGILKDVSVRYRIHMMEEMAPKNMNPDLMEMAARAKRPVYRITDWEPYECSFVPVPADPTVGVGRAAGAGTGHEEEKVVPSGIKVTTNIEKEERTMSDEKESKQTLEEIERDTQEQRKAAAKDATERERQRVQGINDIFEKFRNFIPEMARRKAVDDGMPLDKFREYALNRMEDPKPVNTPVSELGLTKREVEQYSISRAILSQVPGEKVDASFEQDCHKELLKRNIQPKFSGVLVPYDITRKLTDPRGTGAVAQRDLSIVGGDSVGGYLKGTDHLGSEFIDVLRNSMVLRRAGARILSGLRGSVAIPKRTAGATSYWVAEGVAPTEGANTYAQLTLTPKNVAAFIDYTRNLLLQSNPSIDALVNGDLALSIATAIDLAGFHGAGSDEPQGIVGTSNVGATTATTVSFAKMLDFQQDVATANALAGSCAYVTTPAVAAILMAVPKFSTGAAIASPALWNGNMLEGTDVCGFRGFATNQITAGYMIFGDFSQVVIGEWGVLELLVNPYILSSAGIIRVTAFQSVDVGLRYPGAFSVSTSVTAPA